MSGEFGSYQGGYFHSQIDTAATDLANGTLQTTRMWAPFFAAFRPVAEAIAYAEARDCSEAETIMETIKALPALKRALDDIDSAMQTYRDVIRAYRDVIRATVEERLKQ